MATEGNEVTEATEATEADGKGEGETILLSDGRKAVFAGKRSIQQTMHFDANGRWEYNTIDFRFEISEEYPENTIKVPRPADDFVVQVGDEARLGLEQYAAHGAKQKHGDLAAGVKSKDGQETTVEDLYDAIKRGVDSFYEEGIWSERREASGLAGTSVLLRAMVAYSKDRGTGKTVQDARDTLKGLDAKTKLAMRNTKELKPYVEKIEAARAAKLEKVDTSQVLVGW